MDKMASMYPHEQMSLLAYKLRKSNLLASRGPSLLHLCFLLLPPSLSVLQACERDMQCGLGLCCAVSLWLRGLRMCAPRGLEGDECHPYSHKVGAPHQLAHTNMHRLWDFQMRSGVAEDIDLVRGELGNYSHASRRKQHAGAINADLKNSSVSLLQVPYLGKRQHHTCPCLPHLMCTRYADSKYRCTDDFKNMDLYEVEQLLRWRGTSGTKHFRLTNGLWIRSLFNLH